MRVLVTNDDGIDASGLRALVVALDGAGHEVTVVAPLRPYSGASAAILIDDGAGEVVVEHRNVPGAIDAWAVGGAPALGVLMALRGRFGPMSEVVVSGVNDGANTGRVLLHSGTVGAALTAASRGVRAIAVSLDAVRDPTERHWSAAADLAVVLLGSLKEEPEGVVLNLNVPNSPGPHRLREAPLDLLGVVHTGAGGTAQEQRAVGLADAAGSGVRAGSDQDLLSNGFATVTAVLPPRATQIAGSLPPFS